MGRGCGGWREGQEVTLEMPSVQSVEKARYVLWFRRLELDQFKLKVNRGRVGAESRYQFGALAPGIGCRRYQQSRVVDGSDAGYLRNRIDQRVRYLATAATSRGKSHGKDPQIGLRDAVDVGFNLLVQRRNIEPLRLRRSLLDRGRGPGPGGVLRRLLLALIWPGA